jgi:hypothetical protein
MCKNVSVITSGRKYYFGNQIKDNETSGDVTHMGEKRNAYRVLVRKPKGMRIPEKHMCRQEDNTKTPTNSAASLLNLLGFSVLSQTWQCVTNVLEQIWELPSENQH